MAIDTIVAHTIVEVVKDQKGEITGYKLENGEKILKEEAFVLAKQGALNPIELSTLKNL